MSFNFFKNFAIVKAEQVEEGMINLAATLDKEGVAEAAIKQKMDEHQARIVMQQEATTSYEKEKLEYDRELELYNRYMAAAEKIQNTLAGIAEAKSQPSVTSTTEMTTDEAELNADLAKILDKIEQRLPILEKEKQEYLEAEKWLKEIKDAVSEIAKDLLALRETVNQAKQDIAKAELDKERNRKRAEQAEVIAGLRKNGNKFDVAINALKNSAAKQQAEAEQYRIKAESLTLPPDTSTLLDKYSTEAPVVTESLADRFAKLKSRS